MLIGTASHTEIASVGGPESMRYVYALVHSIVRCVKRNSYSAFRLPTSPPLFHGSDPAAAENSDSRKPIYNLRESIENNRHLPSVYLSAVFFYKN